MNYRNIIFTDIIFATILCLYTCVSHADSDNMECHKEDPACVKIGDWDFQLGIGLGMRSNPIAGGDDIPLVLIPQMYYYGKHFFVDNLDAGFTLVETPSHMLNVLLTPGYDGVFFNRWDPNNVFDNIISSNGSPTSGNNTGPSSSKPNELPLKLSAADTGNLRSRDLAILGGIEYSVLFGRYDVQLQYLTDVSNTHSGDTARAAITARFPGNTSLYEITLGFNWKSAELLDYYYGLHANETPLGFNSYQAGSGTIGILRFSWEKPINSKWKWRASIQYEYLPKEITHSPFVLEDEVITGFIGTIYDF